MNPFENMEKAYDGAVFLKEGGKLVVGEGKKLLHGVVNLACDFFVASAKKSATPLDDLGLVVEPKVRELAHGLVDKIGA